jgi:hypothetical protein
VATTPRETNPRYHALISEFKARTGCPVIVNTSFNIRGEPIVCTPEDAFRCFMGTDIEVLVVGNCFPRKEDQDLKHDYQVTSRLTKIYPRPGLLSQQPMDHETGHQVGSQCVGCMSRRERR